MRKFKINIPEKGKTEFWIVEKGLDEIPGLLETIEHLRKTETPIRILFREGMVDLVWSGMEIEEEEDK